MKTALTAAFAAIALTACQTTPDEPLRATAQLKPTKGNKTFGEATFEQVGDKVRAIIYVQGLKPGQAHGLHIHEKGDCSSPDATSAGGHFNPHGKPHGHPSSAQRHAGDLPALQAAKNGRAKVDVVIDMVSLRPGAENIIGRSVIVHAQPDDFKTQPTGDAGARLACGVIQAG